VSASTRGALRDFVEADRPPLSISGPRPGARRVLIDFDKRRAWIDDRLGTLRADDAEIIVGFDAGGKPAGFVTIDPNSGYLDQLCVAPSERGSGLP
jgi:hypothetical protein